MHAKTSILAPMLVACCFAIPAWAQVDREGATNPSGTTPSSGMEMEGMGQHPQGRLDSPFMKEMMGSMNIMHKNMMGMATMNGVADHDFLAMMVHHHKGALSMSETYLKHGQSEKFKKFARGIIAAQKKEIDQMDAWMKEGVGAKK